MTIIDMKRSIDEEISDVIDLWNIFTIVSKKEYWH